MKTRLPEYTVQPDDSQIREQNADSKMKAKQYTDKKRCARESTISPGDTVLVKQRKHNKLSSHYNPEPATVLEKKGSMVTVSVGDKRITRDASHFKPITLSTCTGADSADSGEPLIRIYAQQKDSADLID